MKKNAFAVATLSILAGILAGCVDTEEIQLKSAEDKLFLEFDGTYHWPAPVATDARGKFLPSHSLLNADDFPLARQQMTYRGGAEPNIGVVSHEDGNTTIFVTTFDDVQRSRDYGQSWQLVHDFVTPNYPVSVDRFSTADPMLWVDPDTDRVFVNHMHPSITCTYLAWSQDEGETWSDQTRVGPQTVQGPEGLAKCATPGLDHQKIMTSKPGPRAADNPLSLLPANTPLRPYQNLVYMCVNKVESLVITSIGLGTWCAVSYDSGRTWVDDKEVFPPEGNCSGINGHPAAHPDGTVFVPQGSFAAGANCPRPPTVAYTEDNGKSWVIRRCDSCGDMVQTEIDPDLTFTPDGTGYFVVRAQDQRVYLFRSKDKFATWEGPFLVSPENHRINVFTAITSGSDGRIAMAYLGSTHSQIDPTKDIGEPDVEPSNVTRGTIWHLYVTESIDAQSDNMTFVTHQVTPDEDPVQIGCVWLRGGFGGPFRCRNLLDFIDMTRDESGRYYVAFTDGCTPRGGCTTDIDSAAYQSRDSEVAVAVQVSGMGLFGTPVAPLALQHPQPFPRNEDV